MRLAFTDRAGLPVVVETNCIAAFWCAGVGSAIAVGGLQHPLHVIDEFETVQVCIDKHVSVADALRLLAADAGVGDE